MNSKTAERLHNTVSTSLTAVAVVGVAVLAGSLAARLVGPSLHDRYFLWVTGRALGLASYFSLTALVLLGVWLRHPWRLRYPLGHAETRVRVHAALAVATLVLVLGHLSSLAADKYAGVGWWGAVIPGASHYRTTPVALGVIAWFAIIVFSASAGLAGRRGTKHWLLAHRCASLTFVMVWLHATLTGTDSMRLRLFYSVTGLAFVLLSVSRYLARPSIDDVRRFFDTETSSNPGTGNAPSRGTSEVGPVARVTNERQS
ncbi:MAG: hypothetical protein HKL85_07700 [Acidimicrobiaceae bacterium]|nr:hypothetical protein [Acidimicrobiaceae bacterium]